ncbi:hypothetical protein [Pandoraea sputorum]|uniref:hypothetical protein n=1 Tax=Pandoraea sputorum TaxID=93222 RepID=UPI001240115D|nr:hypothetical protein [Pandoraea sputorum]
MLAELFHFGLREHALAAIHGRGVCEHFVLIAHAPSIGIRDERDAAVTDLHATDRNRLLPCALCGWRGGGGEHVFPGMEQH